MDYENIYQDFYSKYYDKAEFLIKQFLIKRQSQNKIASNVINEVSHYFFIVCTCEGLLKWDNKIHRRTV